MNLDILIAIAPIFLLILLGHALRRGGIPSLDFWNLNDKLVYWVLFPCLLFHKIATNELPAGEIGDLAAVLYLGFGASILFGLVTGAAFRLKAPLWTSLVQASARHNTFIALAFAERVFDTADIARATLASALLIPVTNVVVVTLIVVLLRGADRTSIVRAIMRDLIRNPLLIAVLCGAAFNLSGVNYVPILYDMTRILGSAAVPIVLLCVGANIRAEAIKVSALPISLSIVGKLIVFPAVIALAGIGLGMEWQIILIALLFGAAPCTPSAYTLARGMGGDAPAVAAMVAFQTALSFVTMPLTIYLAFKFTGL